MKIRTQPTTAAIASFGMAFTLTAALLPVSSRAADAVPPPSSAAAAPEHLPPGIAWRQGDVDAAFALAKATHKPLFLYWGAVWCPPCNQVKATIFSQQAFKDRAALFVPVYLDGDSANAQKLGERFKVRGYPTMILFSPDGTEVSRLPGEVDFDRYMQALALAMNATHPIRQTVEAGLAKGAKLSDGEWRMLADYSWSQQADLPIAPDNVAVTLQTLSQHAQADRASGAALRLELEAVAGAASGQPPQTGALDKTAALAAARSVLADPKLARANFDVLVDYAPDVVRYLSAAGTPQRTQFVAQWDGALKTLSADASLSTTDRLAALGSRIAIARLDAAPGAALPKALVDTVRSQAALADKATTNAFERHAVIDAAADALADAGLLDDSDRLLTAELKRSHAPYYFMSGLARNAKARGDNAGALKWSQAAYDAAQGSATRLRWGAKYLTGVIDLTPNDDARVERIATGMIGEISQTHDVFYGANRTALERVAKGLAKWNGHDAHRATVGKIATELGGVCGKLPASDPQRATCDGVVKSLTSRA